ncbi:MAG: hypothetical protein ACXABV_15760 [Candidatus Thorarchaeota archaeon]
MSKTRFFAAIVIVIFMASSSVTVNSDAHLEWDNGFRLVKVSTGKFALRYDDNWNSPRFGIWNVTAPTTVYQVSFWNVFEAYDNNSNGVFEPEHDSLVGSWFHVPRGFEFLGFETEDAAEGMEDIVTALHFTLVKTRAHLHENLTTMADKMHAISGHGEQMNVTVELNIHFLLIEPDRFKVGIQVTGWKWTYINSLLVFQFTIREAESPLAAGRDTATIKHEGNRFTFGAGWMEYEHTADCSNSGLDAQVHASYGNGIDIDDAQSIYFAFQRFGNETLSYDPVLGISGAPPIPEEDFTPALVSGSVLVVLVVCGIACVRYGRE